MKKSIYTLAMAALFTVPMFMACESVEQKEEKAKEAQAELDKATNEQAEKERKANETAAWVEYRSATEAKILANADRIAELRVKKAKPGKVLDGMYAAKIDALQTRNADLQTRLDTYETERSDWESFKREFEHDMEELGKALDDLGNDNTK